MFAYKKNLYVKYNGSHEVCICMNKQPNYFRRQKSIKKIIYLRVPVYDQYYLDINLILPERELVLRMKKN